MIFLLAATLAVVQHDEPIPPTPYDRVVAIELTGADPLLAGHGRSKRIDYVSEFSGTLHIWTRPDGELDTFLRVEGDDGQLVQEDDNSGGWKSPYSKLEIEPGRRLKVSVAMARDAAEDFAGDASIQIELHFVAAPETDDTRGASERAKSSLVDVSMLREAKNLDAARELAARAIDELVEAAGADTSELVAARAWELGLETYKLSIPKVTARAWQWKLNHCSRTLPSDHPDLQTARSALASQLKALGDDPRARSLYEQVLEVRSRTLPDGSLELQSARLNMADYMSDSGDLEGARVLLEGVVRWGSRALPEDHAMLQMARQGLATTLYRLGDMPAARALAAKVLEVRSRTLPDDHPHVQWARGLLAATLQAQGDYARARELKEQVLEVSARTLPDDDQGLQRARGSLATTLASMGELATASALLEKVVQVYSRTVPDDHPALHLARLNLARSLADRGDLLQAGVLAERVLEVLVRTRPDAELEIADARQFLAATLWKVGDLARARELEQRVLDVFARTLPEDAYQFQAARKDLAFMLAAERARTAGDDDALRREFAQVSAVHTRVNVLRAREALRAGSGREAEERCASLLEDFGYACSFATGLGVFPRDPDLEREVLLLSEITRGAALSSAEILRRGKTNPRYAELHAAIRSASEDLARLVQQRASAEAITRARASREAAERELVALAKELMGEAGLQLEVDLGALSALVSDHDALVSYRRYRRSVYEPGGGTEPQSTESLCAFVVRARERLVRVELGPIAPIEHAVAAWRTSIDAGGGTSRGIGVSAPAGKSSASDAAGEELRRLVFDPLREALADTDHLVVALDDVLHLVPLDALPAEASAAMPARGDRPTLLGERWRIEVRSTLTEILSDRRPAARAGALVTLGDVAYDEDEAPSGPELATSDRSAGARNHETSGMLRGGAFESGFARLPATGVEARGIAAAYRQVFGKETDLHVLEHEAASRANLAALAPRALYLHIATHGWFAPDSLLSWSDPEPLDASSGLALRLSGAERVKGMSPMLLCGLALAGANAREDELGRVPGLLTAEELSTLDLSNCELVVLSACDTNVGERRAGQGVASLQKALQMAGARSVITSLWKVPDVATKDLMLDFYRRLWVEKKPKHQALWEAKTALREAKDERGAAKYTTRDWAAWVLTGNPE